MAKKEAQKNIISNSNTKKIQKGGLLGFLRDVFLPAGYPDSVSKDYWNYQKWDSLQALMSYLSGMFATRSMMQGVGVGNANASIAAATLTWLLRDGTGMIGQIVFAWSKGSELDCNSKTWRWMADITNDIGMSLELIASSFPEYFLFLACLGSVFRAITGVAGGCTKSAIARHQAIKNNMADVGAKDGSQETAVSFLGLLLSFVISPLLDSPRELIWFIFIILTFFHLFANYMAVSSLVFNVINSQRGDILFRHYLETGNMLSPNQVASKEIVLHFFAPSNIVLGIDAKKFNQQSKCGVWLEKMRKEAYLVFINDDKVIVVIHSEAKDMDILKGFYHASVIQFLRGNQNSQLRRKLDSLVRDDIVLGSYQFVENSFSEVMTECIRMGWDMEHSLFSCNQIRADWDRYLKDN
eukprot:TRINITY_DN3951_c0_g1_i3.p1 TRINITY_DN3951_c0_g1~~TRINITY_DN3951_c0_g1_i3.p1  ORF type:complete len:411 (-),score=97.69 TRINITY_DN3951_c0_g1_i3:68-1300(-)